LGFRFKRRRLRWFRMCSKRRRLRGVQGSSGEDYKGLLEKIRKLNYRR